MGLYLLVIMPGKAAEMYKSFLRKNSNKNYAKRLSKEFVFSSTVKIDFLLSQVNLIFRESSASLPKICDLI